MGKQSQLLLKPTEVEFGLQVGVEFDKIHNGMLLLASIWIGHLGCHGFVTINMLPWIGYWLC